MNDADNLPPPRPSDRSPQTAGVNFRKLENVMATYDGGPVQTVFRVKPNVSGLHLIISADGHTHYCIHAHIVTTLSDEVGRKDDKRMGLRG